MSENNLKSFLEKVKSDPQLREKVRSACASDDLLGKAVALAKEEGYDVSIDHLRDAAATSDSTSCIPELECGTSINK